MNLIPTRRDTKSGRFYEVDGQLLPSVTTILQAINKPALVPWAANQERKFVSDAAATLYEELASTTQAYPRSWYLAALESRLGLVKAHARTLAAAGDIGSECHKLIEWTMRDAIGAVAGPKPIVCDAATWAFMSWQDWAKSVHLKPILIERTVYSKRHGFAGTLDLLARVNGERTIVDFKTGKAVYHESFLQSAAYGAAMQEMGYGAYPALIVRLPKIESDPAFQVVPVPNAAELFPVFLAAKALWTWSDKNEQRWRSRPKAVA